jgi:hypothetical protein
VYLCVSYDSDNKKKIFPYAATADSFYNRTGESLLRGKDCVCRSQCNATYKEAVPLFWRLVTSSESRS